MLIITTWVLFIPSRFSFTHQKVLSIVIKITLYFLKDISSSFLSVNSIKCKIPDWLLYFSLDILRHCSFFLPDYLWTNEEPNVNLIFFFLINYLSYFFWWFLNFFLYIWYTTVSLCLYLCLSLSLSVYLCLSCHCLPV